MTSRALLQERDAAPPFPFDSDESAAITQQLQRLLESPGFRSSKRCRVFLEHVIKHSLTPGAEPLKERALGMQVFGREPSYDTAADPIVRVTAGEIRRRLGQYYGEPTHQRELRVEIPAGSYTPSYIWPAPQPAPVSAPGTPTAPLTLAPTTLAPDPHAPVVAPSVVPTLPASAPAERAPATGRWPRRAIAAAAVIAALLLLGALTLAPQPSSPFDRFWAPLIHSKVPVLLCTGSVDFYELPGRIKRAADAFAAASAGGVAAGSAATGSPAASSTASGSTASGSAAPGSTAPGSAASDGAASGGRAPSGVVAAGVAAGVRSTARPDVTTDDGGGAGRAASAVRGAGAAASASSMTVDVRDVRKVGAGFVSVADAVAIVRIASLFQEHRTPYQVREKRATSFSDLRTSPTVLIGMFSNAWTLQLGKEFRFVPVLENGSATIKDREHPERLDWHIEHPWPALTLTHDYALVSRVLDPVTGTMVVIGAGITPFGTTAAAEFLTSPHHLEAALRSAPRDWPSRNLQIVLETRVIDGAATPPRVLATHVW